MIRVSIALGALLASGLLAGAVHAEKPANPHCWGTVSSQLASAEVGAMGAHASAQSEPRVGLGNATRLVLGEDAHISDFGTFLAGIDEFSETECP